MSKPKPKSSLKDLTALLQLMRENGVVSFKQDGLELILMPEAVQEFKLNRSHVTAQNEASLQTQVNKAAPGFLGKSEEEILFYSSTGN